MKPEKAGSGAMGNTTPSRTCVVGPENGIRNGKAAGNSTRPEIAVIMIMYNSNLTNALMTLASVIIQEGVDFEIIIADDGSKRDLTNTLFRFAMFNNITLSRIKIIKRKTNVGTVENIMGAISVVEAPYIKLISPGDLLYSPNTLKHFLKCFLDTDSDIVFGKGVYFSFGDTFRIYNRSDPVSPRKLDTYSSSQYNALKILTAGFGGILGASIAYNTEQLKYCISILSGVVRYVEDNTSVELVLATGGNIKYLDEYVIWYEYGSGVSTSDSNLWKDMMKEDYEAFYELSERMFPDNILINRRTLKRMRLNESGNITILNKIKWKILHPSEISYLIVDKLKSRYYKCKHYNLRNFLECLVLVETYCSNNVSQGAFEDIDMNSYGTKEFQHN